MSLRHWVRTFARTWLPGLRRGQSAAPPAPGQTGRGPVSHVLILDGTLSSLTPGAESNAGLAYRLCAERHGPTQSLYYEAGLQWQDWRSVAGVLTGQGIDHQIRRAYGTLANRYRPGDRVILLGYSRGAYAVRSLAGAMDMVGLLRAEHATQRNVDLAWRHYQSGPGGGAAQAFRAAYCHATVPIAFLGVWDTVKALGLRLPVLWRLSDAAHAFHSHHLGASVQRGCQALAMDETRVVLDPVLWETDARDADHVDQIWFRGSHGDIGGQLSGFLRARPLSNIPLVWMLEQAEVAGLDLPPRWQARFVQDADAPSMGTWRGWGKLFWLRRRRVIGRDASEAVHGSAFTAGPGGARRPASAVDGHCHDHAGGGA